MTYDGDVLTMLITMASVEWDRLRNQYLIESGHMGRWSKEWEARKKLSEIFSSKQGRIQVSS